MFIIQQPFNQDIMYSEHSQPPFRSSKFYIILDALFLVFSVIFIIVDAQNVNNVLKYVKPFPVWILMIQLWSLRQVYKQINTIVWGLFFGSLGDIFLLFQKQSIIYFALGAGAFLIGHLIYVPSLVNTTRDLSENRTSMRQVLNQQPLFIGIWLVLVTFSFWSISTIVKSLQPDQQYLIYVLSIYGSCLVLLTMGGFFFFFNISHTNSKVIFHSGLCFMFGALTFFASDNLLAHGKFNIKFTDSSWQFIFSCLIMITYYVAQFLITKGAFLVAVYYTEQAQKQGKAIQIQENI